MKVNFEDIKPGMLVGAGSFPYGFKKIVEKTNNGVKILMEQGNQLFEGLITKDKFDKGLIFVYDIKDAEIERCQGVTVSANIA